MNEIHKKRNRAWAKALQANKRKAIECMRDKAGGRCCLQVAEDVAIKAGLSIPRSGIGGKLPREEVAQFFGWEHPNPTLKIPYFEASASDLNDGLSGKRYSHAEIAECVLNTYCRKRPEWKLVK